MEFILHIFLRIEESILDAFCYIFNYFSTMPSQLMGSQLISKPQTTTTSEEARCIREVHKTSYSKYLVSESKTETDVTNYRNDYKNKHEKASSNTARVQTLKQNELAQKVLNALKHQLHCIGDSCDSLKPVGQCSSTPIVKLEESICSKCSNRRIEQKYKIKVNTFSKHTICLMEMITKNADVILKLLDEMNLPLLTFSSHIHNEVLKDTRNKNSYDSQSVCKKIKSNKQTFCEENICDLCCCPTTHHCLMTVDSIDAVGEIAGNWSYEFDHALKDELITPEDIASVEIGSDEDWLLENELLTAEELASVETGSDEDWLYKPQQNNFFM